MSKLIWSFGGGTQTNAICILIAKGLLPLPDRIVFADTGGEMTEVWDYMNAYTKPLLKSLGRDVEIAPHSLAKVDLYKIDKQSGEKTLLIPAFTKNGKMPTFCSSEWKTRVIRRYIGGSEANPNGVIMWIGMSPNEIERLKSSDVKWIEHHWPLCDMPFKAGYGIRMNRIECEKLIQDYGWPPSPRSACVWCPHLDNHQWQRMKQYSPSDFNRAIHMIAEKSLRTLILLRNNSNHSLMGVSLAIVGHKEERSAL